MSSESNVVDTRVDTQQADTIVTGQAKCSHSCIPHIMTLLCWRHGSR